MVTRQFTLAMPADLHQRLKVAVAEAKVPQGQKRPTMKSFVVELLEKSLRKGAK